MTCGTLYGVEESKDSKLTVIELNTLQKVKIKGDQGVLSMVISHKNETGRI